MNIRNFVSGSSLLLAAWLGATFLQEVPSHRYPLLGKERIKAISLLKHSDPQGLVAKKGADLSTH